MFGEGGRLGDVAGGEGLAGQERRQMAFGRGAQREPPEPLDLVLERWGQVGMQDQRTEPLDLELELQLVADRADLAGGAFVARDLGS